MAVNLLTVVGPIVAMLIIMTFASKWDNPIPDHHCQVPCTIDFPNGTQEDEVIWDFSHAKSDGHPIVSVWRGQPDG